MKIQSTLSNSLLAITACLLWSTPFVIGKLVLDYMAPLSTAGTRFLLAGLIQLPFCGGLRGPFGLLRTHLKTVLLVSLFQTILLYAGFFIALTLVRGAQAAIVVGTGPLISAIVAHFAMHDDKLKRRTLISTLLGISGVIIISLATKPWTPTGTKELLGMGILLFGSVVSAFGNVVVARERGGLNPIHLNSIQMIFGGVVLLVIALPIEGAPSLNFPPVFYAQMAWLAVVSAAGFGIWFHLLSRVKISKLNIWKFIIPIGGAILSWIFLPGESPDWPTLCGMAIIVWGVIIGQKSDA
jgi:drug/metabolite transporter (DMT)-like permease